MLPFNHGHTHDFLIRVSTVDGELVTEDTDFSEDARFDWFSEVARQAEAGEVVQLISISDDRVILEELL